MLEFVLSEPAVQVPADEKTLMAAFGLMRTEALFLQELLRKPWVGRDEFPIVKYPLRQVVYTLRMKMEQKYGVYIVNDMTGRYSLPTSSKVALKNAILSVLEAKQEQKAGTTASPSPEETGE